MSGIFKYSVIYYYIMYMGRILLAAQVTARQYALNLACFRAQFTNEGAFRTVREMQYNQTNIRFVGVSHIPATFARYAPLLENDIAQASVVVLEGDSKSYRKIRSKFDISETGIKKWPAFQFFQSIEQLATKLHKKVHCFEPETTPRWKLLLSGVAIYGLPVAVPLFAFADYLLVGSTFATTVIKAIGALAVLRFANMKFFLHVGDTYRRDVIVASKLKDFIEKESPEIVVVVYGTHHIPSLMAYLQHPALLASRIEKYIPQP